MQALNINVLALEVAVDVDRGMLLANIDIGSSSLLPDRLVDDDHGGEPTKHGLDVLWKAAALWSAGKDGLRLRPKLKEADNRKVYQGNMDIFGHHP